MASHVGLGETTYGMGDRRSIRYCRKLFERFRPGRTCGFTLWIHPSTRMDKSRHRYPRRFSNNCRTLYPLAVCPPHKLRHMTGNGRKGKGGRSKGERADGEGRKGRKGRAEVGANKKNTCGKSCSAVPASSHAVKSNIFICFETVSRKDTIRRKYNENNWCHYLTIYSTCTSQAHEHLQILAFRLCHRNVTASSKASISATKLVHLGSRVPVRQEGYIARLNTGEKDCTYDS